MSTAQRKKEQLNALVNTSAINQKIKDAYMVGQKQGIYDTINLVLWTLHAKEDWGNKRLTRVYNEVVYLCDCVIAGTLSLEDVREALKEECKIIVGEVK